MKHGSMKLAWMVAASAILIGGVSQAAVTPEMSVVLKAEGAVEVAEKEPFGGGISSMVIGYNAEGKAVAGMAVRETPTYKKTSAVVTVVVEGDQFKISSAEIPDIESFHGKSKDLAQDALTKIKGNTFKDSKEPRKLVDGVTGATKYLEAIYVSYSLMTSRTIETLTTDPGWPRKPLL